MEENVTDEGNTPSLDFSSFGIGIAKRKSRKTLVDLSPDPEKPTMFVLPLDGESSKGKSRKVFFNVAAFELFGGNTENFGSKDTFNKREICFNFGANGTFIVDFTGRDQGQLPANSILPLYNSTDYLGVYCRNSKLWNNLGGNSDDIVAYDLTKYEDFGDYKAVSFKMDAGYVMDTAGQTSDNDSDLDIPDASPATGDVRGAVTSYEE